MQYNITQSYLPMNLRLLPGPEMETGRVAGRVEILRPAGQAG